MPARVDDFLATLAARVQGELRQDAYSRILYSTDASIYRQMPYGVLLPATVEDVHAAVELAAEYRLPILPRGAGSSLAGQACNEALVIDFTRHLDQILAINAEERWVRVQPGVVLDELNLALRPFNLQFGPDPASSNRAAMGGIVANNSTGSHSILYGMTADHVRAMNVILNDGSMAALGPLEPAELDRAAARSGREGAIYRGIRQLAGDPANQAAIRAGTPRHWRRCGGYNLDRFISGGVHFHTPPDPRFNLARLVCGSEGSLAVMTEIELNLVPRPAHTALAIIHFDALRTALAAVPLILETGPSAVELLDNLGLTLCREVPEYARLLATFVDGQPNCILITEYDGASEAELPAKIGHLGDHLRRARAGATAVTAHYTPRQQANVWTVRKVGLGLMMSIKGDHKPIPFIEDAAVPVEHLAEYVLELERFCNDLGTQVAYYAHASAGCVHIRPLVNTKQAAEIARLPAISQFSVQLLRGYGGSLSSEHGDGKARSWLNEQFFGPELYALYRQVKGIFDPANILNPGTIVDGPPMTANLRFGSDYRAVQIPTHLDFRADRGFDRAVEMCNGAGVCRKRTTGTMCPSFMVTREEEHSTRGRANALRAALSGALPVEELTSPRMYQVMALCISCKACQAECPSSVDMARIKSEFLAQYHDVHGAPLRDQLFARIGTLGRLASGPPAPLANWLLRRGLVRWGLERFLGISRQRPLPAFARRPFHHWYARRPAPPTGRPVVALCLDAYAAYEEPAVAVAATELLEAAGFAVALPGVTDYGRPAYSKGLIKLARHTAQQALDHLAPLAAAGRPLIFLEPSDLSVVVDDYPSLWPDDPRVARVAGGALSLEQFIADRADAGELPLVFTDEPRELLLHAHCHQKALFGTAATRRALSLPPGYRVREIDSSCCGMAGSFGYEAEHYAISLRMAERRLLTAVRAAPPTTLIVAPGVSCRQQIRQGSGRRPLHPAEVLRAALREMAVAG